MEELIREMVSKLCPFHGKRAVVNLDKAGQIEIKACCKKFLEFQESLIKITFQQRNYEQVFNEKLDP